MTMRKTLWLLAAALLPIGAVCFAVSGMRFSGALCWAAGAVLAALALLDRMAVRRSWARRCEHALLALVCAGSALFAVLEAQIVSGARGSGEALRPACIVVLGAGVDGTRPSLTLQRRLEAALALAETEDAPLLVSGSRGLGEDISEAECMARWLAARGVEPERIWREEQATSTRTNFIRSLEMMAARGVAQDAPFAVVTSDYHVARARFIASELGIPQARLRFVPSSLPRSAYYTVLTVNYYVREAFALANEMLLGVDIDL